MMGPFWARKRGGGRQKTERSPETIAFCKRMDGYYPCNGPKSWDWVKPETCRNRCKDFPCTGPAGQQTAYHQYVADKLRGKADTARSATSIITTGKVGL